MSKESLFVKSLVKIMDERLGPEIRKQLIHDAYVDAFGKEPFVFESAPETITTVGPPNCPYGWCKVLCHIDLCGIYPCIT